VTSQGFRGPAFAFRASRPASATHRPRSRSTPTWGSGPTPTAKPARSSMPLLAVCPACARCPCLAGRCAA